MSSINNKEKNFISAVVYLHNDGARAVEFCRAVAAELDSHFAQYELVVVDDACTDDTVERLRAWGKDQAAPLTILHMSLYHGLENAMNAGLDASIGDYVYEFDSTELCYPAAMIFDAYRTALQGSDIVSVCPKATRSGLFYRIFNANSHSNYQLRTDAFRLVTRRAINRVHASSAHLPYRKAAYAACGLKMTDLEFDGRVGPVRPTASTWPSTAWHCTPMPGSRPAWALPCLCWHWHWRNWCIRWSSSPQATRWRAGLPPCL